MIAYLRARAQDVHYLEKIWQRRHEIMPSVTMRPDPHRALAAAERTATLTQFCGSFSFAGEIEDLI